MNLLSAIPWMWRKFLLDIQKTERYIKDCNETQTQSHLVRNRMLPHLAKLVKRLSCVVSTYLYAANDGVFSNHITFAFTFWLWVSVSLQSLNHHLRLKSLNTDLQSENHIMQEYLNKFCKKNAKTCYHFYRLYEKKASWAWK